MSANKPANETERETFSGEQLARAVAEDFEHFFLPFAKPVIAIEVNSTHHACIRGDGESARIVIPVDMAREVINEPDRLFFHLLILGHEIAHLMHRHLHRAREQDVADYRALEYWADFYGAKVVMTLITYGPRVQSIFKSFFTGTQFFETALESIGRAVGRLVQTVYVDSDRYPKKLLRVGLTSNGITSFLRREMTDPPPIWYFSVFKRIHASPAVRELMLLNPEHAKFDIDPIERARDWHRTMQGASPAITPWFKPEVLEHLHTSFDQTDEERAASERIRLEELQAAGFLLDDALLKSGMKT